MNPHMRQVERSQLGNSAQHRAVIDRGGHTAGTESAAAPATNVTHAVPTWYGGRFACSDTATSNLFDRRGQK